MRILRRCLDGGPKQWRMEPGQSALNARIVEVQDLQRAGREGFEDLAHLDLKRSHKVNRIRVGTLPFKGLNERGDGDAYRAFHRSRAIFCT